MLLVTFAPPDRAAKWARAHDLPYRLGSDVSRRIYFDYGLGNARLGDLINLQVVAAGVKAFTRSRLVPRLTQHGAQVGGYFVVDDTGKVVFAYPSKGPGDYPNPKDLLAALGVE